MSNSPKDKGDYTEEEAQRRFEATLKGALNTPPKHKGKNPLTKAGVNENGDSGSRPSRRQASKKVTSSEA